jgi:hypothetical protein
MGLDINLPGNYHYGNVTTHVRAIFCENRDDNLHCPHHFRNFECGNYHSQLQSIYFGLSDGHFADVLAKFAPIPKLLGHKQNRPRFPMESRPDSGSVMDPHLFNKMREAKVVSIRIRQDHKLIIVASKCDK